MSEEYEDMDDQCCDTDTGDCSPCIDSTDDDDDSCEVLETPDGREGVVI